MPDNTPKVHSPLNPNVTGTKASPENPAPTMNGTSAAETAHAPQPSEARSQASTNGTKDSANATSKKEKSQPKSPSTADDIAEAGAGAKLTGAALKKQKQAEKAARRADKVALKGEPQQITPPVAAASQPPSAPGKAGESSHKRRQSAHQPPEPGVVRLPLRPSNAQQGTPTGQRQPPQDQPAPKAVDKRVPFLTHLYAPSRSTASLSTASKDLHPDVITLSLQLRDQIITGSNARTVATLLVLKRVIKAYSTPAGVALSRHLTTHLSHQITFLSSARPLGVAQGNSIRWLKKLISTIDPDSAEADAKRTICAAIDAFIREKITLADELIASQACARLQDEGEVLLVYGKSSVVEKTLLRAAREDGKTFKVVVVDSRPLFEGKNLARSLLRAGMKEKGELDGCEVSYALLSGLADLFEQERITKCVLGASAMLGNGRLQSRAGAAMVAAMAKGRNIPVIVLAETVKFTGRTVLDSLSMNEIGSSDALVEREDSNAFTVLVDPKPEESGKKGGGGGNKKKGGEDAKEEELSKGSLEDWRDQPNLYLLNLMYDVTPPEFIDMVICELGILPPSAVPVVNGVHGGDE